MDYVIYGGSFNPVCYHHFYNGMLLAENFDRVFIYPCWLRPDKHSVNGTDPFARGEMSKLSFGKIGNVRVDLTDITTRKYTPTLQLDQDYRDKYPLDKIWHAFGTDLLIPDENGAAQIDTWAPGVDLKKVLNIVAIQHPKFPMDASQLPKGCILLRGKEIDCSSTLVRKMVKEGKAIGEYVQPEIAAFIKEHRLYK